MNKIITPPISQIKFQLNLLCIYVILMTHCGDGGTGRHVGFRFLFERVGVQGPLPANEKTGREPVFVV